MSNITNTDAVVTESKLTEFYNDIKPFLGCPAYVTQEGDAEYYSTDEKVVGMWVDNKPLYKKTYVYKTDGSSLVPTNINTIDKIVAWEMSFGQPNDDNSWWNFINDQVAQGDGYIAYDAPNNKIGVSFRQQSWGANRTVILTIKYTKQNDSASTTIEQKPTHYSTDEQVVGTWIDGKPLYQKTFQVNVSLPSQAGAMAHFDASGLENIDTLVSSKQLGYDPSYRVSQEFHCRCDYIKNSSYPNGHIRLAVNTSETGGDLKYLTIQYTKTTD